MKHGARRDPAQQPDRRLAIARKDPVLVGERVNRPRLHRFVVPEDGVRADPALTVVDDRTLVVRAEQDERAVDGEELVGAETVDLLYFNDAASDVLGRSYLDVGTLHASRWQELFQPRTLDEEPLTAEQTPGGVALLERRPVHDSFVMRGLDGREREITVTAFP